jgi:hypothetical protein
MAYLHSGRLLQTNQHNEVKCMRKLGKSSAWVFFALFVGLSLLVLSLPRLSAQSTPQTDNKADVPVTDYESATQSIKSSSAQDAKKAASFNGRGGVGPRSQRIAELPQGVEPLPTQSHWDQGLPALPISQSTAIILGKVVTAQARLSDDGTGIYSEFSVEVNEVLKDTTGSIVAKSAVSVNRVGGGVRFASGKIQLYRESDKGYPTESNQYVLFLKRDESGYWMILTGYKLSEGGVVSPLDGWDSIRGGGFPVFAKYNQRESSDFLSELKSTIEHGGGDR